MGGKQRSDTQCHAHNDKKQIIDKIAPKILLLHREREERVGHGWSDCSHKANSGLPSYDTHEWDLAMTREDLTWLMPFVAPRDARLGDAAEMNIKMAPILTV